MIKRSDRAPIIRAVGGAPISSRIEYTCWPPGLAVGVIENCQCCFIIGAMPLLAVVIARVDRAGAFPA